MILISRKRIKRERSTPNGVISRLYTSRKQMNIKKPDNAPAARQLDKETYRSYKLACTEQPYVRTNSRRMKLASCSWAATQLAIATMNECRSYKLACTELPYVRKQQKKIQHRYLIAIMDTKVKANSLTSLKTFDSCNEQTYILTQLAIARTQLDKATWIIQLVTVLINSYTSSASKAEELINSTDRKELAKPSGSYKAETNIIQLVTDTEQPYVRTQLAIATQKKRASTA